MTGFVKTARAELSTLEVMWWRAGVSVPLGWLLARGTGFRVERVGTFLVRLTLGFAAMFGFFTAARGMELADLSIVTKLQPILIAVGAPMILGAGERVDGRVWGALGLGLAGSFVLLAPDLGGGSLWGLWAVGATVAASGAHVALRKLGRTESPATLVFWFQLALFIACSALLLVERGQPVSRMPVALLPYLLPIGVAATAGQIFMTWAYKLDRAALVAAASYVVVLWAAAGDLVFFGAAPGLTDVLGGVLVIAAGWLLLRDGLAAPRLET